jgi:homospermidine synthase
MAPYNNATSLQVVSSIVAGMHWMLDNPKAGIVESEQLDYQTIYNLTAPYWAPIVQQYIEWQPAPHSTYEFNDFRILSTAKQHGKITSQA